MLLVLLNSTEVVSSFTEKKRVNTLSYKEIENIQCLSHGHLVKFGVFTFGTGKRSKLTILNVKNFGYKATCHVNFSHFEVFSSALWAWLFRLNYCCHSALFELFSLLVSAPPFFQRPAFLRALSIIHSS